MKKFRFAVIGIMLVMCLIFQLIIFVPASANGDLVLPVIIRDFHGMGWGSPGIDGYYEHPDFEDGMGTDPGIVQTTIGVDKKPVYAGQSGNPTTHGQTAFDQWYRDTATINMRKDTTLTLTWDSIEGEYVFDDSSFFPIDGELLNNGVAGTNYHFTLELHNSFTYQGGENFLFRGDDDVFVFIDGQLVIDLGGVHSAQQASVDLDTLGLTVGETYNFDLFFAERHTVASSFRIETTIVLEEDGDEEEPPVVEVGGNVSDINKASLLAPWIVLTVILAIGTTLVVRRYRVKS